MANPLRGEVALNTRDGELILKYTINSLCELEKLLGRKFPEIARELQSPATMGATEMRAVVWAGLRFNDPPPSVSRAGDILQEVRSVNMLPLIDQAFVLGFPEPEEDDGDNPPPAAG